MDLKKIFTQRVNILFGFGCLLPIINVAAGYIPASVTELYFLFTGAALSESASYWVTFILPQFFYPIASALLFLIPLSMLKLKVRDAVEDSKTKFSTYLIYVPMLLALSYVLSFITNLIFLQLEGIGIKLPTVEAAIPQPGNALEILALFFVMAVLPAICEEFIYRVVFAGVLSPISFGAAIILSSIAFGLMHATIQQIPFAFCLGIILAFSYIKTKNYKIPVLMHFLNNFISCIFHIAEGHMQEEALAVVSMLTVAIIFTAGIIATVFFFINERKMSPGTPQEVTSGQALKAAVKAPMFWIFIVIYLTMTVLTTLAYMYIA